MFSVLAFDRLGSCGCLLKVQRRETVRQTAGPRQDKFLYFSDRICLHSTPKDIRKHCSLMPICSGDLQKDAKHQYAHGSHRHLPQQTHAACPSKWSGLVKKYVSKTLFNCIHFKLGFCSRWTYIQHVWMYIFSIYTGLTSITTSVCLLSTPPLVQIRPRFLLASDQGQCVLTAESWPKALPPVGAFHTNQTVNDSLFAKDHRGLR